MKKLILTAMASFVLVAVSVIFIALAALFLFKAFVGYEYARVPTPLTLKCHYDKLNAWHKKYGDGESAAERKFEESFNIVRTRKITKTR